MGKIAISIRGGWWQGDYSRHRLPSGALIAVKNDRSDLFEVVYRFRTGFRRTPLLCLALDLFERSGAGNGSAQEQQKRLFRLGTQVETACDADETTVAVRGIDRNMKESIDILEDWMRHPHYEKDTLKKLLDNVVSARKDQLDDPNFIGRALGDFAGQGPGSAYLAAPPNRTISGAKESVLTKLITSLPDQAHRTSYFGPMSGEAAAELVSISNKEHATG